ncbi:hypothetical protein QN277_008966 [Acacia crassicarpa]|uniref:PGG domain-containing protein n=1 Tax=Acacia crassicarpa TaxID=499986 RepID=A0AAE1ISY8_9FABA|nr:hypothetical protein QN277_008966 [Acacia crassicarpa]
MSTWQSDDLEQNSSIHLETDVSSMTPAFFIIFQNSSIHSETDVSSSTSGEQLCEIEESSPTPHEESETPNMSTLQSDVEQNSSIHSETDVSSSTSGEQLCEIEQSSPTPHEKSGTPKMSALQSNLEQNSSIHSETDVSSMTSGEQLCEIEQSSPTPHEQSGEEEGWKRKLCHAICVDCWNDAKAILDQNYPQALKAEIGGKGRTALHVAAMFGRVTIVKKLLKLLKPECLKTKDSEHFTALALACEHNGCLQVVECLVNANIELLGIENGEGELPAAQAIKLHLKKLGRYLYCATPLKHLTDHHGSMLIHHCFKAQHLEIALDLLQQREELLLVPNKKEGKWTPIHDIASLDTAILSPSKPVFWKRWIYNYIIKSSATATNHICVDIQQNNTSQEDKEKLTQQGHGLLQKLITSANNFVGIKKIQKQKQQHERAEELLGLVCKNAWKVPHKDMYKALTEAAKMGNSEFLLRVSKEIPEIFVSRHFFTFFSEALEYRQAKVFNLIHGFRFKTNVLNTFSPEKDTMLQKAAIQADPDILNRIYAPTLQMQKELQWFKEVESLTPSKLRGHESERGKTGKELFREKHKDLMEKAEKWMKETATSCSLVGTLIVTIMFAAAFSVPGGNDQNLGYPLHIKQPVFNVFIITTILSLLFSTASVLMFLAILTSQHSEDEILNSIPKNLILGLSCLFISIVCMLIAFLSTIDLMMKHKHYSLIFPIIILVCVSSFRFMWSQFPLLRHTFVSTYCNIFDRKVDRWP